MKSILSVWWSVIFISCAAHAADPKSPFDLAIRVLSEVARQTTADPGSHVPLLTLNKARLPDLFTSTIREADTTSWHSPTQERLRIVRRIEALLDPYQSALLKLATRPVDYSDDAFSVLSFAAPSSNLKASLQDLATNAKIPHQALRAYDVLFMLRLDDQAIRDAVVAEIKARTPRGDDLGSALLPRTISWGMEGAESVFADILRKDYIGESTEGLLGSKFGHGSMDEQQGEYQIAAKGLMLLGRNAEKHIPLLRKRLSQLEKTPRIVESVLLNLRQTIDVATGKQSPPIAVDLKGTGPLGLSQDVANQNNASHHPPSILKLEIPTPNPQRPQVQAKTTSPADESTSGPWIVGVLVFVIAAVVIVLVIGPKSSQ